MHNQPLSAEFVIKQQENVSVNFPATFKPLKMGNYVQIVAVAPEQSMQCFG